MTHEELLAKLDTLYNNENCSAWVCEANYKSLRAVVELHKPLTPRKHMCDCNYCPPFDCEKCETFYPCKTIQVIEKELG